MIVYFDDVTKEEIDYNRPQIKGVDPKLIKYLGNHKNVQDWDFISWKGKAALLVPKRYVILKGYQILDIYLLFKKRRRYKVKKSH